MEKLIMGIDPGTNFMGYAFIKIADTSPKPILVVSGVLDMDMLYLALITRLMKSISQTINLKM